MDNNQRYMNESKECLLDALHGNILIIITTGVLLTSSASDFSESTVETHFDFRSDFFSLSWKQHTARCTVRVADVNHVPLCGPLIAYQMEPVPEMKA